MNTRQFFEIVGCAALLAFTACNSVAAVPPLSPQAQLVRVETSDPPLGAKPLGAVQASHGDACQFNGELGTEQGATALLKEAAVRRGADFVKVTRVTKPYSGHDCYHREFIIEGLSYRVVAAPIVVPSAVVPVPAAPAVASVALCTPICSPGYQCEAGICRPQCNPACGADQVCRADRVCVPASPAP